MLARTFRTHLTWSLLDCMPYCTVQVAGVRVLKDQRAFTLPASRRERCVEAQAEFLQRCFYQAVSFTGSSSSSCQSAGHTTHFPWVIIVA